MTNSKIILNTKDVPLFLLPENKKLLDDVLKAVPYLEKSFYNPVEISIILSLDPNNYDPFAEEDELTQTITAQIYCADLNPKKAVQALGHFEDFWWIQNLNHSITFLINANRYE